MNRETLINLAPTLPCKEVIGHSGVLLRRYALLRDPQLGTRVYLHQFLRGDEDRELHSHPWPRATVLILAGGYVEQRCVGLFGEIEEVERRPGDQFDIPSNVFHRVDRLLAVESWSLIWMAPKEIAWCFLDPKTRALTPWQDFITKKYGEDNHE